MNTKHNFKLNKLNRGRIMKFAILLCLLTFAIKDELFASEIFIKEENSLPDDPRELYINLMKRILVNTIYEDSALYGNFNENLRANGMDWPTKAHTMVGTKRLDNLHYCLKTIIERNIPGDCIETGVWRGGCTILMRAILKAYHDSERKVWVADSFEGFPLPNRVKYPADRMWNDVQDPIFTISVEQVMKNFQKYGLLDKQVVFVKGFFSTTLPNISINRISLLRLDGDWYESTMDALMNLYPKLSKGGFIIIDDYSMETCRKAVTDFRNMFHIIDPIFDIDGVGVYWEKTTAN